MERGRPEPTAAQQKYIEREMFYRRTVRICRAMLLVLLLALWELCTRMGMMDAFIFSSPTRVARCLIRMAADGSIFGHIGITLGETLLSFLLTEILGIAAALLLWSSRIGARILEPYLVIGNSLPKSALAPILIVWLGSHTQTIVTAAVSVAVFGTVMTLYHGFAGTDPDKIRLIESLGGTRADVLFKVLLPGCAPLIISNMKVNIGLCLVGVIIGEFLAAKKGLGYLIIYGSQVLQ